MSKKIESFEKAQSVQWRKFWVILFCFACLFAIPYFVLNWADLKPKILAWLGRDIIKQEQLETTKIVKEKSEKENTKQLAQSIAPTDKTSSIKQEIQPVFQGTDIKLGGSSKITGFAPPGWTVLLKSGANTIGNAVANTKDGKWIITPGKNMPSQGQQTLSLVTVSPDKKNKIVSPQEIEITFPKKKNAEAKVVRLEKNKAPLIFQAGNFEDVSLKIAKAKKEADDKKRAEAAEEKKRAELAEKKRLDKIAEQKRLKEEAEKKRLAALAEKKRLKEEAKKKRLAAIEEKKRLAKIAKEKKQAELAEKKRLAKERAEQKRLAKLAKEAKKQEQYFASLLSLGNLEYKLADTAYNKKINDPGALVLNGKSAPNMKLNFYLDKKQIGSTTAGKNGVWQFKKNLALKSQTHKIRVEQLDNKGNVISFKEKDYKPKPPVVTKKTDKADVKTATIPRTNKPISSKKTEASPVKIASKATDTKKRSFSTRPSSIVVVRGDTLWGLATTYYGDGMCYMKIYKNNRNKIKIPDLIFPGQNLDLP